eukprot:Skav210768  [mRNA]  locus=scaffold3765:21889:22374:+ [translate_table: standard]
MPPQYLLSEGGRISQQVMAVSAPSSKRFGSKSVYKSKPFEDAGSLRSLSKSSVGSLLGMTESTQRPSRISEGVEPRERRKSGQMLALTFEDHPKMQDYLSKSNTFENFVRKSVEVPDIEQGQGPGPAEVFKF